MRGLLGVLRDDQPADLAPQPDLADLPSLVETARQAGLSVELSGPAALNQVPSGVGMCAYRIVQESLSNASQHAPGAAVTVSVDRDSGAVLLQVANGPGEPAGPPGYNRRSWSRPDRDARTGRAARRVTDGRTVARRRLRGLSSAPPRRHGMTTSGEMPTRCLIADDQAMVREGFAAVLNAQPDLLVVGQAVDGADAARQARDLKPDVVLMDVRMPVMDGLQAARQILAAASPGRPRMLMLTTFDLDEYVYEALQPGASGFLLKDATAAELIHAVRVVASQGDALLAPSVTRRLIADFARQHSPVPQFPPSLGALTQRETEVLRLIAQGLSNTQISNALIIAEQTTKTHIGRILAKLNLRDHAGRRIRLRKRSSHTPRPWPSANKPVRQPRSVTGAPQNGRRTRSHLSKATGRKGQCCDSARRMSITALVRHLRAKPESARNEPYLLEAMANCWSRTETAAAARWFAPESCSGGVGAS